MKIFLNAEQLYLKLQNLLSGISVMINQTSQEINMFYQYFASEGEKN